MFSLRKRKGKIIRRKDGVKVEELMLWERFCSVGLLQNSLYFKDMVLASLEGKCRVEKLSAVGHCSLFNIFQPSLYCSSNSTQFFSNKYFS